MLPGEAPGRGAPGLACPGRGACGCGRGMGRSTDGVDENGLLPTRGGRIPGLGPGTPGGPGRGPGMAGGAPGGGADWAGGCPGVGPGVGDAGRGGAGVGAWGVAGGAGAAATAPLSLVAGAPAASPGPAALGIALSSAFSRPWLAGAAAGLSATLAGPLSGAGLLPPNASRNRRATGASTVDDADLTNSPCSFSRARTSLLVTPSSLANSCTRALPATTSPV